MDNRTLKSVSDFFQLRYANTSDYSISFWTFLSTQEIKWRQMKTPYWILGRYCPCTDLNQAKTYRRGAYDTTGVKKPGTPPPPPK